MCTNIDNMRNTNANPITCSTLKLESHMVNMFPYNFQQP